MGKMKALAIKDVPHCRAEKHYFSAGEFFLFKESHYFVRLRHVSGEGFSIPLPTFEAEVCPWEELGSKANVAELVADFYSRHF